MQKSAQALLKPVAGARILLAEDNAVSVVFAEQMLRDLGVSEIDCARDGQEAITRSQQQPYDLIFMDCQMPGLDGYEATKTLRRLETRNGQHTPIVAMTGNDRQGDREACLAAGMDNYISKPIKKLDIKWIMQQYFQLENEAPRQPPNDGAETGAPPGIATMAGMDGKTRQTLFALFMAQADEMIAALENKSATAENTEWQAIAHRLKGSAGNLGAMKLHGLCAEAEEKAGGSREEKQRILREVKTELAYLKNHQSDY